MYQRDYLMRQIEQAARAVAAILKRALGGDPDGALAMFDEAYQPLLGISARVVSTLTDEQLVTLLTSGSWPDLRRVISVLEVVKAEADVNGMRGDDKAATTGYRRSLSLAAYVAGHSDDQLDGGLATDDDVLEAGGLPRDEVKAGLAELLRRQVPDEPLDWDP